MQRISRSHRVPGRKGRRCVWLLALAPVTALIWAGAGLAAPSDSTDLKLTKADSPDPVTVGTPLTYTIQAQNLGPGTATGVVVTDSIPKGVDFASASSSVGQCARKGKTVTCPLGELGAPTVNYGGSPTVTLVVIPRKVGTVTNTASIKGGQKDPVGSNNKATAITTVVGPPATCRGIAVTAVGTERADTIAGTNGPDVIATLGGNDTIVSLGGRDLICAGRGNDYVGAGPSADRVFGGAGKDRLLGRGGPDLLKGGAGNDVLKGNRGADRLRGGSGVDGCLGGAGADSTRSCERTTR
jgi:uncharacterized repeat protein (TIGR01451 family)